MDLLAGCFALIVFKIGIHFPIIGNPVASILWDSRDFRVSA